jgi:cbb3-type cytochrome oxidase subunit 1
MDWFVKAFLKASLTWLGAGVTLGIAMAVHPAWTIYRTAHFHMNLLGFVAMMIFGVAYHVIPRFTGHALHNRGLAVVHWWFANLGLLVMVLGLAAVARGAAPAWMLVAVGGVSSALGAYAFIYNIWRTIDGPRVERAADRGVGLASPGRRLPVADQAR